MLSQELFKLIFRGSFYLNNKTFLDYNRHIDVSGVGELKFLVA
jgi:hypothetical protein